MKHIHHIIPKHAGGSDEKSNLVELTIEQHAEEHRKLYEEYGRLEDLIAWKGLSGQWSKYQILKKFPRQGVPHSEKTKKKISASKVGYVMSEPHKENIRKSRLGKTQTENQKMIAADSNSKDWIVTDPEGNSFEVRNLRKFARENNLDQGNMMKVAKGICRQHKGFSVVPKYIHNN